MEEAILRWIQMDLCDNGECELFNLIEEVKFEFENDKNISLDIIKENILNLEKKRIIKILKNNKIKINEKQYDKYIIEKIDDYLELDKEKFNMSEEEVEREIIKNLIEYKK